MDRSRGGPSTKVHAQVDALGNPVRLLFTEDPVHAITQTRALVCCLRDAYILADKGYDSRAIVARFESQGCSDVIPARKCSPPRTIGYHVCKEGALAEGFFQKLERHRHIAMRFEKLTAHFLAMEMFAAALVWLG